MPAFFLELFSEEIPARMQARAAADLARLVSEALAGLSPADVRTWHGPRRIALAAMVNAEVASVSASERGPRISAPEQALLGFLRKHGASREQARQEGEYWVLDKQADATAAPALLAAALPGVLRRMPWPKSMRWGGTSGFTWVRPLRRIVCLLDGAVVPFSLREGSDDGHGLTPAAVTEGHRFHAPGAFPVSGAEDWIAKLRAHRVLVDAEERKSVIAGGIARLAAERGIVAVDDPGLLEEVAGLVEWPVPLAGRIAGEHMDLPPEVMRVSMRINQRYFATRAPDGKASAWFLFAANVETDDDGAAIVAGNERVLRARFSDARHFWDLDRKARLESRVPALEHVTYHARLGTQAMRVERLRGLARTIAPMAGADVTLADRAAELAKADLVSGMVGEFPELQGVMGRYYAAHDQEDAQVADAVRDHYAPRGPTDPVPVAPVSVAVALADKLDQLACFFAIGERPTGAGDPYALRRAALGVIRIIRENGLRMRLLPVLDSALAAAHESVRHSASIRVSDKPINRPGSTPAQGTGISEHGGATDQVDAVHHRLLPGTDKLHDKLAFDILDFLTERLRVQLRAEGARHDVLTAVLESSTKDDDLTRLLARAAAVATLLDQDDGANLLSAYRRAANILRIEERKDGPHTEAPDTALLAEPAETALHHTLDASRAIAALVHAEDYAGAMAEMAKLRGPLDAFFEHVTVNAPEPETRRNRLRLLNQVRTTMNSVADFSRIEG